MSMDVIQFGVGLLLSFEDSDRFLALLYFVKFNLQVDFPLLEFGKIRVGRLNLVMVRVVISKTG